MTTFKFEERIKIGTIEKKNPIFAFPIIFLTCRLTNQYKNYQVVRHTMKISKNVLITGFQILENDLKRTSLARFDLYYLQKLKSKKQIESIKIFMENCCQKIHAQSKRRKAKWNRNLKDLLLRI